MAKNNKRKNSKSWLIVLGIIVAGMIGLVQVLSYLSKGNTGDAETTTSVIEGTAGNGEIKQVLTGYGSLKQQSKKEVKYGGNVEITELYFKDGDMVKKGDVIAKVDPVSVMTSIKNIQTMINSLDKDIKSSAGNETSDKIITNTKGKVKVINVKEGQPVINTMYDKGYLIGISIDGLMCVDYENVESDAVVGDECDVTKKDGTVIKGKVASNLNNTIRITMSDSEVEFDEEVSVKLKGKDLGKAKAAINSPVNITAYTGDVKSVSVKVNDSV